MDEERLFKGIKKGDSVAFKLFFEQTYGVLLAYLTTLSGDRVLAEELAQQSFVALWESRKLLDVDRPIKPYLFTIAHNEYKRSYKDRKYWDTDMELLKFEALEELAREDTELLQEKIDRLRLLIEELPVRCKQILVMNKFEGLRYTEIAAHLGISVKTVEAQMRIAYGRIRKGFKKNAPVFLYLMALAIKGQAN